MLRASAAGCSPAAAACVAQEIAQTIATAHGPSGPNYVYLVQLAEALRKIGRPDADVEVLEQHVLRLLPAEKAPAM